MLYPIMNSFRSTIDLSGFWRFRTDPGCVGEQEEWYNGCPTDLEIAVPGSWNEQLEEAGLLHYVGAAWYFTEVRLPRGFASQHLELRVGSADYHATVWVNGVRLGENCLGFLPFAFPLPPDLTDTPELLIVIRVDNRLTNETIPQGITSAHYEQEGRMREETFPPARFDFSPFGGIHRPVTIVATPHRRLERIAVTTAIDGTDGTVDLAFEATGTRQAVAHVRIEGNGTSVTTSAPLQGGKGSATLGIAECRVWCPDDPFLYTVTVSLEEAGEIVDEYTLHTGVREVRIEGDRLLLNGKPLYLQGFGKHEDAFAIGKGLHLPLLVKDFQLMKWIGANSFRTSHYPYAEEWMAFADRKGILVIDEVPAVSLDFRYVTDKTFEHHREYVRRLIERDSNHPSVIMWALGNEPNLVGENGYGDGRGRAYWKKIFTRARELDPSRPMVVPNCLRAGIDDPVLEFSDIACINRYYGWYEFPGQLDRAMEVLAAELDQIHEKYGRPVMMTEFGADTIPGLHSVSDQMFTEEYQESLLSAYIAVLRSKDYTVGEHVWNFADFRTPQNLRRVMLNMKGVFSRTRSPKMAAHALRKIWTSSATTKV